MSDATEAAFELRYADLKALAEAGACLDGSLLAASSAHDPDPSTQRRVIRLLIDQGVPIQETDKNGVTPLHRAVRFRSPAAVKELLSLGADTNAVDRRSGATPLHRAVTNTGAPQTAGKADQAAEIARLLLAAGADPSVKNKNGKAPLDYVKDAAMKTVFHDTAT